MKIISNKIGHFHATAVLMTPAINSASVIEIEKTIVGQEVYWGWPGGGSRAVRDVLCGKDVHSVITRDRKLQISLIFVARTKRTVRFDIWNRINMQRSSRDRSEFRSQIGYFRDGIHRRQNSLSMPQRKTKRIGDGHAESPSLRKEAIRAKYPNIHRMRSPIYRIGRIVYNVWVKIDSQAHHDDGTRSRRARNCSYIRGSPEKF